MENKKVLIIEKESIVKKDYEKILNNLGYMVKLYNHEDNPESILVFSPDIILMEPYYGVNNSEGFNLANYIENEKEVGSIIYITSMVQEELSKRIPKFNMNNYFSKPIEESKLVERVRSII